MAFVRNCRFDNLGVFTYSDEEGTPRIRSAEQGRSEDRKAASLSI
jgi:tRNA A37 methylthiotransferase MiaB